jgi:hypothetical protein
MGQCCLPLFETVVLHRLLHVRSDELPDLAARWLASDLVDTESVRVLAGYDRHDPRALEQLLADSVSEANIEMPSGAGTVQQVAIDWVSSTWRQTRDTRWAVATLAHLGQPDPEFDLGLFIGLNDEWSSGWGRLDADLNQAAKQELGRLLHGDDH